MASDRRALGALLLTGLLLSGCATPPPAAPLDLCRVFREKDDWYEAAAAAQQRWGTSIPILMAFVYHESGYRADAQPPRRWFLGFIPGPRPSSAYGYAQALDETWDHYRSATDNTGADRDEFPDALDFIGWYNQESYTRNGIAKHDTYNLYLAYHEGHGGYSQGSYRSKSWLLNTARRVAASADRYRQQLQGCEQQLRTQDSWWPFS